MNTRTRVTFGLSALLGLGLLVAETAPAAAAPPPHARANGYYRNQARDFDRDGIPDHRDRDIDNDGVLNQRDRDDYTRRAGSSRWNHDRNRRDYDRDGVRNRYDRDRDNDGVRNRYDRHDYNRGRR